MKTFRHLPSVVIILACVILPLRAGVDEVNVDASSQSDDGDAALVNDSEVGLPDGTLNQFQKANVEGCEEDDECPNGWGCHGGQCRNCGSNSDCPSGKICASGFCRVREADGTFHNFHQASLEGSDTPTLQNTDSSKAVSMTLIDPSDASEDTGAKESTKTSVAEEAQHARRAAESARKAAEVAKQVAAHSIHLTHHAQEALKHAQDAVHVARVETEGLSDDQKTSLKKAEMKLKEATKEAEYGEFTAKEYLKDDDSKKTQIEQMREELDSLRQKLKDYDGDDKQQIEQEIKDLEDLIEQMKQSEDSSSSESSHEDLKAEIGKLREKIDALKGIPSGELHYEIPKKKPKESEPEAEESEEGEAEEQEGKSTDETSDVYVDMPYGDLEPFGREDTAQELTEASIRESDKMVDQIENAEVAEEKRAVFRALTRLRGAAITSYDGVAHAQTGNIEGYSKVHKWRKHHSVHHLAEEESDVSKWAFPDNAD